MTDRFRQGLILNRLEKAEAALKEIKRQLRHSQLDNDKEMLTFAKNELDHLKVEIQSLSDEYDMLMIATSKDFSDEEIIDKLRSGWHLAFDGFDRWTIFAPSTDFGEQVYISSDVRKQLVEFGHRAGNLASYQLKESSK